MSKDELIFCPLGGSGQIGGNMNLYAYGNDENQKWIIVDTGVSFADDSVPGIDLIYPDPGFIIDKKDDLLGIILTHAHEDHIGAISHIWPDLKCKIFATPFTAVLIKEKFKEKKIDISNYINIVELNGTINLGPFEIEFINLTHSILEPNGLCIKTKAGTILHTGDWKIDPNPLIGDKINEAKLKEIGKNRVLAMICDSTNIFNPGRAGSELDVRDSLLKIMSLKSKKIIVTSFASNVARMESIFYCAEKISRHVSLVGRSMNRIFKAARQCGYLKNVKDPIDPRDAKKIPREKIVYLCTGSQGEPMGAMKRIIKGIHPDVFIEKDDTIIFSSKIIPGNEKKLYSLHNDIVRQEVELITEETEFVHVSGHPNREDLKDMYDWVKPQSIIPVHGEHRHMNEHIKFAKEMQIPHALQIEDGDIVKIFPGENPQIIDKAPSGKMYLDGSIAVGENSQSIKERKNLSLNGYLEITLILSNNGKLSKPIISFRGIPENSFDEKILFAMEDEIFNTCRSFSMKNKNQEKNLIEMIKQNCRRIIKDKTGKKPFTNINIARL